MITLGYDPATEGCGENHAPFLSLTSIQETASGVDSPQVSLPAVRFEYGESSIGEGSLAWGSPNTIAPPWVGGSSLSIYTSPMGTLDNNLGWGYRFASGPRWPTVEAMMIDVDGDGLIDRLTNNPEMVNGEISRCRASWQRNRGAGNGFAPPQNIEMPTLKWKSLELDDSNPAYFDGGPHANAYPGLVDEGCSLNYQITAYRNSTNFGGGFPCYPGATACPTGGDHPYTCPTSHDDCSEKLGTPSRTILAFRWIDIDNDGRVDLVASPASGGLTLYNFQHGNLPGAPAEPSLFGSTFPGDCPETTYTAFPGATTPASPGTPYTMCGGMFPWFVYKNKGNGVFGISQGQASPTPDEVLYQPVPLETSNGDSSMTSTVVGQFQGTVDLDGDGFLDAIQADTMGVNPWALYLGNRNGVFTPGSGASSYSFSGTNGLTLNFMDLVNPGDPITQEEGLLDLNADGLVDHWRRVSGGTPFVTFNTGLGFDAPPQNLPFRPSSDGRPDGLTFITSWQWPNEGYRSDSSRPFDLDLDGRVDVLRDPNGGSSQLQTYFNVGGAFAPLPSTIGDANSFAHYLAVSSRINSFWSSGPNPAYSWEIRSDLLDIDGDGIPEQLDFGKDPGVPLALSLRKIPTPDKPPRLLVSIDNQRGATTNVTYAPTTDPAVVVQENARMPQIQWVVKSQTTTDTLDIPATTSTTSFKYLEPHFGPDERGHYSFRGFQQIETTLPSGAMREDEYKFDPDLTGRLWRTLMHEAGDMSLVHSIEETDWQELKLFADQLVTYHSVGHATWTCANGQTEAQCITSPAGYTQTASTLTPLENSMGQPCMWVETETPFKPVRPRPTATAKRCPPMTASSMERTTESFQR